MRRRDQWTAAFLVAVSVSTTGVREAQAWSITRSDDLELWVDDTWPSSQWGGYVPVRVVIANRGEDRRLTLRVIGQRSRAGSPEVEKTLLAEAGAKTGTTIQVPMMASSGPLAIDVHEGGRRIGDLYQGLSSLSLRRRSAPPLLIISMYEPDLRQLRAGIRLAYGAGADPQRCVAQIDPAQAPADWISYSQLGVIGISAEAVEVLSPEQREALRKWVAAGGALFVHSSGVLTQDPIGLLLGQGQRIGRRTSVSHYFGRFVWFDGEVFSYSADRWRTGLISVLRYGESSTETRYGVKNQDQPRLEVPGVGGIPVYGYALLITLFAIGIGPVNYIILWKKKKLHLIFAITPAAALCVTVLMACYGFLSEGVGIRGTMASLTFLDQERHEAVTIGRMALYAATAPRGGFRFPMDVVFFPASSSVGVGRLVLDDGQNFDRGWLKPRTMSNYVTVGVRPTRTRVVVTPVTGGLEVANESGATLRTIYLINREGIVCRAENLRSGRSAVAKRVTLTSDHPLRDLGQRIDGARVLKGVKLVPGSFLAEMETSPHFVTGLRKVKEQNSLHVLYGRFQEEGH